MGKTEQTEPWYQRNLQAGAIVTAVGLALGWILTAVFEGMNVITRVSVILGVAVVALLLMSLFNRRWRTSTWVAFGSWLKGLDIVTHRKRAAIRQEGFDAHVVEMESLRARIQQPAWRVDARDALGERNLYWLNNHGGPAQEVTVTAEPEFFVPDGDIHWRSFNAAGMAGGSVGSWFKGQITERGRDEGVAFHVSWVDGSGELRERDVFMPSEEFRAGRDEALQAEYVRGRADGRMEAFAERDAMPPVPLPRPRWAVTFDDGSVTVDRDGMTEPFVLINRVERSVAREVRIDTHPDYFRLTSAGHWADLSGEARGGFTGSRTANGQTYGITFTISWFDERGESQSDTYEFGATDPPHPENDFY